MKGATIIMPTSTSFQSEPNFAQRPEYEKKINTLSKRQGEVLPTRHRTSNNEV